MTGQEYVLICRKVKRVTGIDLSCYKSQQMQRRLEAYLRRSGAKSWIEYLRRLDQDADELKAFRDYLTINVSSFFRDPEKFQQLGERILPTLVRPGAELTMWSAGCSHGAEAYTLAMLADAHGIRRYRVWATDIDRGVLSKATAGGPYSEDDVRSVPPALLSRHFERRDSGLYIKPTVRSRVIFYEHNLLEDDVDRQFDLVVCRNVIIYFSDEAKRKALINLAKALRPGGVLFLGGTEVIPPALAHMLGLQSVGISFYGKLA